MASVKTSSYEGRYLKLTVVEDSYSIANNTSTIRWTVESIGGSDTYYTINKYKVVVGGKTRHGDGSTVYYSDKVFPAAKGSKTGTFTVTHNADGTAPNVSFALHGKVYTNGDENKTGSIALTKIPRQANITGADNFNDEGNPKITYNNSAGNSVTTLQACISLTGASDDISYRNISKTGTSYTFNLTEAERNVLRNACKTSNSLSVKFYVKTVVGGNTYYSNLTRTMTIVNGNPTFSDFTYNDTNEDVTNVTGNNQVLVKGLSTLQVNIPSANKMVAKKSATAKNYISTLENINVSTNYSANDLSINLGTPTFSGTKRLNVRAYDSRNNSTLAYKDITIYDYAKPVIEAEVSRLNSWENATTLSVSGTYSKLTINNEDKNTVASVQYRYRETNGTWSNWTTLTSTIADGRFTCNDVIMSLDNTKSFEFEIKAVDNLTDNTVSLGLDIGQAIFFISTNNKACYINNQEILQYDVIDTW